MDEDKHEIDLIEWLRMVKENKNNNCNESIHFIGVFLLLCVSVDRDTRLNST